MSEPAGALADRFREANARFVAVVDSLSESEWHLECDDEGRTVAALARHVADAYLFEIDAFRAIAERRAYDAFTWDDIHQGNAEGARANANCDRVETIVLLNTNAAVTEGVIRSLMAEGLAETGVYIQGMPRLTVETLIERILIGHVEGHLSSIRTMLDQQRNPRRSPPA